MKGLFSQLLENHITVSGLKHGHLASTAGISYNYLARLLAGTRHPSDQVVCGLSKALHLSQEQTADLLSAAGFVPPISLIAASDQDQKTESASVPPFTDSANENQMHRLVQQFYRLTQEVPERFQDPFLEEMKCLLGYLRYKYVLNSNMPVRHFDLIRSTPAHSNLLIASNEQTYLDVIAQIVGELSLEPGDQTEEDHSTEDTLSTLDQLIGNLLTGAISTANYHPQIVTQTLDILNQGAPWEIRRRIAKALPPLCRLDTAGAVRLMEVLRMDLDGVRGPDIRRRVIEALPALFDADPQSLPVITRFLHPRQDDDIYTALATIEACGDLQMKARLLLEKKGKDLKDPGEKPNRFLSEIASIQRNIPVNWDESERESLLFSIALHNLLPAPDTLLISLEEGLHAKEMLTQLVTVRYLERILPVRPAEVLRLYLLLPHISLHKNVRRAIAKAFPTLLQSLSDTPLSIRTLARSVILMLAEDTDVLIRRAVADHAMQMFSIDREFLQIVLKRMYKDTDPAIRHRLRPVALCLAETWLIRYAETAGLVNATKQGHVQAIKQPFGE